MATGAHVRRYMADDTPDNRVLKANFRTATNIYYVFNRRSRDGRNVPHMEQIEDENYTVSLFIRLLGPDEVSTDNLMNTWGRQLADQFNIIGADPAQYRYPFTTEYVGPLTPGPDLNNHRYVARYLLDTDICTIICRLYDTIPVTELVENTDLMAAYFGPNPARVAAGIASYCGLVFNLNSMTVLNLVTMKKVEASSYSLLIYIYITILSIISHIFNYFFSQVKPRKL